MIGTNLAHCITLAGRVPHACMSAVCVYSTTCRCQPGSFTNSGFECLPCPSLARAAVLGVVAVLASAVLVSGGGWGEEQVPAGRPLHYHRHCNPCNLVYRYVLYGPAAVYT